jgi:hypothetical protein
MLSGYHGHFRGLYRRRARVSRRRTLAKSSVLPIARQNARVSPQAGMFRTTGLGQRSRSKMLSTEIDGLEPIFRAECSASTSARRTLVEIGAIHTPLRFPRLSRIVTATQNERSRARPQPRAAPAGASSLGSAAAQLVARARPEQRRRRSARATTLGPTPGEPTDELEQTNVSAPNSARCTDPAAHVLLARCRLFEPKHITPFPSPSFVPPPRAASSVRPFGPHTEPRGLHR